MPLWSDEGWQGRDRKGAEMISDMPRVVRATWGRDTAPCTVLSRRYCMASSHDGYDCPEYPVCGKVNYGGLFEIMQLERADILLWRTGVQLTESTMTGQCPLEPGYHPGAFGYGRSSVVLLRFARQFCTPAGMVTWVKMQQTSGSSLEKTRPEVARPTMYPYCPTQSWTTTAASPT